jgi:flagellar capping protein FliD
VNVGAGGTADTLAGLATAINNANIGVTASVITSGTAATLSLANSTSGSTGVITVDSSGLTDATTSTRRQLWQLAVECRHLRHPAGDHRSMTTARSAWTTARSTAC